MQDISEAIVSGSLRAITESIRADERNRIENGTASRAERRRAAAQERKERKKKAKVRT